MIASSTICSNLRPAGSADAAAVLQSVLARVQKAWRPDRTVLQAGTLLAWWFVRAERI